MQKQWLTALLLVGLFMPDRVLAQIKEPKSNKFFDNLKIAKGFESEDDKTQPATFMMTLPSKTGNSFLLNAGISYTTTKIKQKGTDNLRTSFAPFFNYNLNTLIEKEQNNYKLGLANSVKFGNLSEEKRRISYFFLDNSLSYQSNRMDTSHNLIVTSYVSWLRSRANDVLWLNVPQPIKGTGLVFFLTCSVGSEFQFKFDAPDSSLNGGIGRLYYHIEARLMQKLHGELGDPFLEFRVSNTGRFDILNSTGHKEGYLPLFVPEILLYPTGALEFAIGFSYSAGSNPIAALPDQHFFQLAIKFSFN